MTEQQYIFPGLDAHAAIIVQKSLEQRKTDLTADPHFPGMTEKDIKATLAEIELIYDDLDRHIANLVRCTEREENVRRSEIAPLGM